MGDTLESLSSYDTNIMLAAIISLLVVILFVLLLHIYAKWFLQQHSRGHHLLLSRGTPPLPSHLLLPPSRTQPAPSTTAPTTPLISSEAALLFNGLEASAIASIPLFVYKQPAPAHPQDCVICLCSFQENEVGRRLAKCGHCFHVDCIDMWLHSHSSCPVCRAPAVGLAEDHLPGLTGHHLIKPTEAAGTVALEAVVVASQEEDDENHQNASSASTTASTVAVADHRASLSDPATCSSSSSGTTCSTSLGCSLKRMLSRNRSESKVFPSSTTNINVPELDA